MKKIPPYDHSWIFVSCKLKDWEKILPYDYSSSFVSCQFRLSKKILSFDHCSIFVSYQLKDCEKDTTIWSLLIFCFMSTERLWKRHYFTIIAQFLFHFNSKTVKKILQYDHCIIFVSCQLNKRLLKRYNNMTIPQFLFHDYILDDTKTWVSFCAIGVTIIGLKEVRTIQFTCLSNGQKNNVKVTDKDKSNWTLQTKCIYISMLACLSKR